MSVNIADYIDVEARMLELGCPSSTQVAILPTNFEAAATPAEFQTAGSATTIQKLLRHGGVDAQILGAAEQRPAFIHNKSHDWVVPIIFVSAELLKENPNLISMSLDLIRDYAVSLFRGLSDEKCIKVELVIQQQGDQTYKKLSYEGNVEGLKELKEVAKEINGPVGDQQHH